MKNKIMNWLETHESIYGMGLLFVSICSVAFGAAYLGASTATPVNTVNVNVYCNNDCKTIETE